MKHGMRQMARPVALLALLIVAFPARAASSFTLENVVIDSGGATYRAAKLDVTDSVLSREDMRALLAATDRGPAPQAFAKVSAARIATPELVADQKAG